MRRNDQMKTMKYILPVYALTLILSNAAFYLLAPYMKNTNKNAGTSGVYNNKYTSLTAKNDSGILDDGCVIRTDCRIPDGCIYGEYYDLNCSCNTKSKLKAMCRYCYQTDHWEHSCVQKTNCASISTPRKYYRSNCTVHNDIVCLGNRNFLKKLKCNWTRGYRWSTAVILSVILGGFGADRFYLGHWQEGIGKLFSFGGLGIWTVIDILLISIRYLGPEDGSLYI